MTTHHHNGIPTRPPTASELHTLNAANLDAASPPFAPVGSPIWFRRPDGVGWRLGKVVRQTEGSVFIQPVGQTFEVQVFHANILTETPPARTWTARTLEAVNDAGGIKKAIEETNRGK